MKLAILIATLPERADKLKRLLSVLEPQIRKHIHEVFYSIHDAGPAMPTGRKRNQLIEQTQSEYFVFIDDDDLVSEDYVSEILAAIETKPDVVTFTGFISNNGVDKRNWTIRLGSEYIEKDGHYYRWPNHIVPMRREKVNGVSFPDVWVQEDFLWSQKIHDLGLLKSEVHIAKDLYFYYPSEKPRRRIRR